MGSARRWSGDPDRHRPIVPERGLGVLTAAILALPAFGLYYLIARATGLA
jgi:hypothetical protein